MRRFLVLPVLGTALFAIATAVVDPAVVGWRPFILAYDAVALLCCALAVASFRPGEFLWWAWLVRAYPFLQPFVFGGASQHTPEAVVLMTAVVNACGVVAALLFVLAYLRSGLEFTASRTVRAAAWFAVLVVGALIVAPTLIRDLRNPFGPDYLVDLASLSGDAACFVLAVPMLLVAVELRGSALATTWWFLGASDLCWLLQDAALAGDGLRAWGEFLACFATLAVAAAALAHRQAVRAPASPRPALS